MSDRSSIDDNCESDETSKLDRRVRSVSEVSIRQEAPCLSKSVPKQLVIVNATHLLSRTRDPLEDSTKFALPRCFRLLKVYDFGSLHLSSLS